MGRSAIKLVPFLLLQVFDATNTTRERRETILQFAEQNGFKVTCWVTAQREASAPVHSHTESPLFLRCSLSSLCAKTRM